MSQVEKIIVVNKKNTLFITTKNVEKKKGALKEASFFVIFSICVSVFSLLFPDVPGDDSFVEWMGGVLILCSAVYYFIVRKDERLEKTKLSTFIAKYISEPELEKTLRNEIRERMMRNADSKIEVISDLETGAEYLKAQTIREELAELVYEALDRGLINHSEAKRIFSKISHSH